MDSSTPGDLPSTYKKGYCYFDVRDGKFWIDTKDNDAGGRMVLNAYKAERDADGKKFSLEYIQRQKDDKQYIRCNAGGTALGLISGSSKGSMIEFCNIEEDATVTLGYLGIWNGVPCYYINDTSYALLHAGNYSSYALPLTGGTLTGAVTSSSTITAQQLCTAGGSVYIKKDAQPSVYFYDQTNSYLLGCIYIDASASEYSPLFLRTYANASTYYNAYLDTDGSWNANTVKGAVWNDYAEFRSQNEEIKPGYITYCDDDGKLKLTIERLQKFEGVVSDTFGFSIGETEECKTPIAVSGRVLVYCDPEEEHFHSGDCVCAGPGGLAYRMTREEVIQFPDRIVGVVSEIPTYERWGTGDVEVDGRIWIRIK